MDEPEIIKEILALSADAWSLYQYSLRNHKDTSFKGLHSEEADKVERVPLLESIDTINRHIIEYALRSLNDKNALDEMVEELTDFYESISIQLQCDTDTITLVDQETLFKISIQNKDFVFIEAWKNEACVESVPVVNTAQFVVLIRKLDRLIERLSGVPNPQLQPLTENVEKIKDIADRFRPDWREWLDTHGDRVIKPLGLYFDKRDADEFIRKVKASLGLDKLSEEGDIIERLRTLVMEKGQDPLGAVGDLGDLTDLLNKTELFDAYEMQGRQVVGENLVEKKLLDLDRRLKQINERVSDILDVSSDKPSQLHLIKNAFNENQRDECLLLLEGASTQDIDDIKGYIQTLSPTMLPQHAELILMIIERKLIAFDLAFVQEAIPVLIDAYALHPLTRNNPELKERFQNEMNKVDKDNPEGVPGVLPDPHMNERAKQIADNIYERHQSEFDEFYAIDDLNERAQAMAEVIMPDLLTALSVEFGEKP